MPWKVWISGLVLCLAAVSGCKQQCFLTIDDYKVYQEQALANLAHDPQAVARPIHEPTRAPMTVLDTNREIRYISLAEAIAVALEQGTIGTNPLNLGGPGSGQTANNTPFTYGGRSGGATLGGSDAIRVLRYDPALAGTTLEASLTKFDAVWNTSMTWQNTDRPVGTTLDTFQAGRTNAIEQMDATFSSSIVKPLPTGGVAGITFNTAYTLTNLTAAVNPAYRPSLVFQFEQPLLQGFGVEINQLRPNHPGSVQIQGLQNLQPTTDGILVSRIRYDQERAWFEQRVQGMVSTVEAAYWNLYYSYWNLFAVEQLLRFRFETLRYTEIRLKAGVQGVTSQDLYLARGQYEDSRTDRLNAVNTILAAERDLRALLQLRIDDGHRLVPSDQPTIAPYLPNWELGYQEAMTLRPELFQARQEVKTRQMYLITQRNALMPDLRFISSYDINAIGNRLDGSDPNNAFRNLADNRFNNWTLGLRLVVPIGFRLAHANVRRAELALAQSYEVLRDSELKVERGLAEQYQRLISAYELIRTTRSARIAYGEQVKVREAQYAAGLAQVGGQRINALNFVLQAQQQWADALRREYDQIRVYNIAMLQWEFAKGTALVRNNIQIAEGPLPSFAQVRAAEHERERAAALQLREHPLAPRALTDPGMGQFSHEIPALGTPLPELMHSTPLLSDVPPVDALPAVAVPPGQAGQPGGVKVEDLRQAPRMMPETLPEPGAQPRPAGANPGVGLLPPAPMPALAPAAAPGLPAPMQGPAVEPVFSPTSRRKPRRDPSAPTQFGTLRPVQDTRTGQQP